MHAQINTHTRIRKVLKRKDDLSMRRLLAATHLLLNTRALRDYFMVTFRMRPIE